MPTLQLANRYPVWGALEQHCTQLAKQTLNDLFGSDPLRATHFTRNAGELTLDFSKNHLTAETLTLLETLATQAKMSAAIQALFAGEKVNGTEQRAAWHTLLRMDPLPEHPAARDVALTRERLNNMVNDIHHGRLRSASNQTFSNIVHIGIGGSHLGPQLVAEALREELSTLPRVHFVSNIDPDAISGTLSQLDPHRTLFIVASKSFVTLETLENAKIARQWLTACIPHGNAVEQHFIAVTSATTKAQEFGIDSARIFPMWDWVGGRYSLWSAIGLPVMLAIGTQRFQELLCGAQHMDEHFRDTPTTHNLPVLLALLDFWYGHFHGASSRAILPYSHRLRSLPAFLQQLDMESNGKSVDQNGNATDYPTGLILWGAAGTDGQHSFHQLLHQGTHCVPCDFIVPLTRHGTHAEQHLHLITNALAQARVLMTGKSTEECLQELLASGTNADDAARLAPHKCMPGNRPSNLLLMDQLTPKTLGALLAMYEHKVYAASVLWNINAFDQWGVEAGKLVSQQLYQYARTNTPSSVDSSTAQALDHLRAASKSL